MKRRLLKNKRGFTLVELLTALLIMGLITAFLSAVLSSTYSLYDNSEVSTTLFNVSQKIHIALNSEFSACQDMYLYTEQKRTKTKYDDYEAMIYLDTTGYIFKDTKDQKNAHILLSERSYKGAKVKSFSIKYIFITEKMSYDDDGPSSQRKRALQVTTVLSKGKVEYVHTSTIRLYNMQLWGTEIVPSVNSATTTFGTAIFHYSQYYDF